MAQDDKKRADDAKAAEDAARASVQQNIARNPQGVGSVTVPVSIPVGANPPPPGIFSQVAQIDAATVPGQQRHTFGAWCRAKGVSADRVRSLMQSGQLKLKSTEGDGPEMSESEFDAAVAFEYRSAFGTVPGVNVHVPADQARAGAPSRPETAAEADARDAGGGSRTT